MAPPSYAEARRLAIWCQEVYEQDVPLRTKRIKRLAGDESHPLDLPDFGCSAGINNGLRTVAFCGSNHPSTDRGKANWDADFHTALVAWPKALSGPLRSALSWLPEQARFHQGWAKGASEMFPRVLEEVNSSPLVPTTVAGHSLGTALATLVGAGLVSLNQNVRNIVTFGAPRCMNRVAAAAISSRLAGVLYRLDFWEDPWIYAPPDVLVFPDRYAHAGTAIKFDSPLPPIGPGESWNLLAPDRLFGATVRDFKSHSLPQFITVFEREQAPARSWFLAIWEPLGIGPEPPRLEIASKLQRALPGGISGNVGGSAVPVVASSANGSGFVTVTPNTPPGKPTISVGAPIGGGGTTLIDIQAGAGPSSPGFAAPSPPGAAPALLTRAKDDTY